MSTVSQGVRRTEGYVYSALHWAFPLVPVVALALVVGPAPLWISLPHLALATVAAWAGLSVLHTRLRDRDLLPASGWDLFRTAHLPVVRGVWVVASLATVALTSAQGWRDLFIASALPAFLGAVLALPLLGRPQTRPLHVGLVAVALAETSLWAFPVADDAELRLRSSAAFWVAYLAAMFVGFSVMFRNVLQTTRELERARETGAKLAVAEERLRFSRDLHDVFGRTLSAVALKAELGAAQAERGRPEAAATMREVQAIAVAAQQEVRDIVRGYRDADLAAEVAGARALLEAAGVQVTTLADGVEALPAPVARAFAWAVREATTNILRHADATMAHFAIHRDASGARLEVTNDGPRAAPEGAEGSGLRGLTERLREVGGTLSAGRRGDQFVVTTTVDAECLDRLATAEGGPA